MRLKSWNKNITDVCISCKSKNVSRVNPNLGTLLYFPSLFIFKHVNLLCFDCGNDWYEYYFK